MGRECDAKVHDIANLHGWQHPDRGAGGRWSSDVGGRGWGSLGPVGAVGGAIVEYKGGDGATKPQVFKGFGGQAASN